MNKTTGLNFSVKVEDFLKRLRDSAKNLSILERQKVIRLLVKEVLVGADKITIKHSIPITGSGIGEGSSANEKKNYQLCKRSNYADISRRLERRRKRRKND